MGGRAVLFLDIDGVLNRTVIANHIRLESELVARLKGLVEAEDLDIVLSTFWRHFTEYVGYVLHRHKIDATRVIGCTPGRAYSIEKATSRGLTPSPHPTAEYANRACEIRAWLDAHPHVTRYVILDDKPSAAEGDAELEVHFVRTDPALGLTAENVEDARSILQTTSAWAARVLGSDDDGGVRASPASDGPGAADDRMAETH